MFIVRLDLCDLNLLIEGSVDCFFLEISDFVLENLSRFWNLEGET